MRIHPALRSPAVRLLAIDLIVWQLVALWIWGWDMPLFTADDPTRAALAAGWASHPYIFTADGQWPPLPFYLFGAWRWLTQGWGAVYWYIPAGALMTGLGAAFIGLCGLKLAGFGKLEPPAFGTILIAALLPLMIRDNWRIAATPLSEPPYLMLLAAAAWWLLCIIERPPVHLSVWGGYALLLVAFQMTRYEAVPLAYVAWTTAWLMGRPREFSRRDGVLLLFAGWQTLALFPLFLMVFHQTIHGNALAFVATTREYAETSSELSTPFLFRRLAMVIGWMKDQGEAVLVLALVGIWLGRKSRAIAPIAVLLLSAWGLNILMASENVIGIARPSRFTLGFLWMCIPPAVLAWERLGAGHWRRRVAMLIALGGVLVFGFQLWSGQAWGGLPYDDQGKSFLESLGRLAREDGYTIVIEDPDAFPAINLLRLFSHPENVRVLSDYSEAAPAQGTFLYIYLGDDIHRRPAIDARRVQRFYEYDVARFESMPPKGVKDYRSAPR